MMCTMSSLAAAILWWHLKPSVLSCMTSSRNSTTVKPSAVWARTSLAMRSSSTAESTVRRSSVKGGGAFSGPVASALEQGSAGLRRPRVACPQGTSRYLAMNLAASFDPYFTSCVGGVDPVAQLGAVDPGLHDVEEEVDYACGRRRSSRGRCRRVWAASALLLLLYRPGGRWYRTCVLLCGRIG